MFRSTQHDSAICEGGNTMKWLCCQIGAREHYAIPRALFRMGMLEYLLTDAWFPPSSLLAKICGRGSKLAERFHDELSDARVEEAIVAAEAARVPELAGSWHPAPAEYWAFWREEFKLADRIVVNSEWSREGLVRGGVPAEKISVIPLAYEGVGVGRHAEPRLQRNYPHRFTAERPMRVLFLGLINLRKGVARLLEAARILCDEPVEF